MALPKNVKEWLHGLAAAVIGGGSSAVVAGITSMGFAPDKFNLTNSAGVWHLIGMILANFAVSGLLSMFFYLRQSPLPTETTTTTQTVTAAVTTTTETHPTPTPPTP